MNNVIKRWLPDVIAVVLFAVLAFAYFYPSDTEGRILYQHDTSAGTGAGQEAKEYMERTGERTRWTNSLFGGMPTYQIAPSYNSTSTVVAVEKAYHLWLPDYVWHLFAYLLGFYILLRAFDFKHYLAALGSIFWAFSTYFLIIIAAGHMWKVMALAYLPPLIGGIVLAYRGKYLWGLIVTSIFCALEIHANHMQMTYYYAFIIFFMAIAYLVEAIQAKQMSKWLKATGVCLIGGLLGVLVNISNLYHTWEYSQQTMRGGTELSQGDGQTSTDGGLDRSYITQWSYGIGETWTLLVPNAKGGSHNEQLKDCPAAMEASNPQLREFCGQWYQYWGEQPFTAGPVYVGAFVLMLFILGLFIVKGPMKWALLGVTILSILLSWGKNFMGLTDFFIDVMPLYAKFRTVSSILVIAEFTIPLLAMMALKKIIDEPEILKKKIYPLYASFGLTAGFCLLFALMPTVFFGSLCSDGDVMRLSQYAQQGYFDQQLIPQITDNLSKMRIPVFTADCWRSFFIIVIGTLLLMLYRARKLKALPMVGAIAVLCLVDLWMVNKRYLNDSMFVDAQIRQTSHAIKPVNQQILKDTDPDFRVLNFAGDTFNENETSFYHKSVGGYHAAKLGRYNELITAYLHPEMQEAVNAIQQSQGQLDSIPGDSLYPVINMLNTKYFIISDNMALPNPYAQGNAWFVDKVQYVTDANEELAALGKLDLRHEAVADKLFESVLQQPSPLDSTAVVSLSSYEPNLLKYSVNSQQGGILVFSEIYYPGWTATIDGQPAELGRVNYVLRAMHINGGQHEVVLSFDPQSVKTTETIAYVALIVMVVLILAVIGMMYMKKRNEKKPTIENKP
ncbi:MAG: YfhO family protein [Prevotella sp.]|nr:YfhO family protein [Prevotella sp.]